jgi:transposase
MIPAVIERCAGIDVGKAFLTVCLLTGPADGEPKVETRKVGTFHSDLEALRQWLSNERCTHAVMESTGSYGKPVFSVLESSVTVILANGQDDGWRTFSGMVWCGPVLSRRGPCVNCVI